VYVPVFRKGRFDQLDEPTSPFNIASGVADDLVVCLALGCPTLPPALVDDKPEVTVANAQGGARVGGTVGRLDWSVAAYRGFEPFGLVRFAATPPVAGAPVTLVRTYPRFTMVGGDFETVRGAWGIRGEIAAFVEDNFQTQDLLVAEGSSVDAGLGLDRKAGDYRVSAMVVFHRESYDPPRGGLQRTERHDVSIVGSADRSFARDRYSVRTFAVVTPSESSGFLRAIVTFSLRDNVALEGSGGWFAGEGRDFTGRFAACDFLYVRLKYYF
jgi:hypothetical protein